MTVCVEVFTPKPRTTPIEVKRFCVDGVSSYYLKVIGKRDYEFVSTLELTFRCLVCEFRIFSSCELKHLLLWDEESEDFADYTEVLVDIEKEECEKCASTPVDCTLPCFDPDCEDHESLEFDPVDGWSSPFSY
jgi:hypothetical protein